MVLGVATLACVACVPASEPLPPAGAFGFVTEPSPATRGEPFVTSDGWTVRVETLVLQIDVSATPQDTRRSSRRSETYRIDASQSAEVFARSLPVGPARGTIGLASNYIGDGSYRYEDRTEVLGVSPEVNARFQVPADGSSYSTGTYRSTNGPSLLLVARAAKEGHVVQVDLALEIDGQDSGASAGEVVANGFTAAHVHVFAEALFTDASTGMLRFDDLAAVDDDHDGRITGQELVSTGTSTSCPGCNTSSSGVGGPSGTSIFAAFRQRCDGLFGP
jgi:hypothetical protein